MGGGSMTRQEKIEKIKAQMAAIEEKAKLFKEQYKKLRNQLVNEERGALLDGFRDKIGQRVRYIASTWGWRPRGRAPLLGDCGAITDVTRKYVNVRFDDAQLG